MNSKLVTIGVIAAVAAVMVGALAVSGQNAFARQFDDQKNEQNHNHFHGKNNAQVQQNNVNDENEINGGIHQH
jgi:hypothetical protein